MTTIRRALVVLSVTVILGGCSDDKTAQPLPASAASSSSVIAQQSSSVVDQQSLGPVPNGYAARATAGIWRLVKSDPAASSVTIVVAESGCTQVDHVELAEAHDSVSIRAVTRVLDPTASNYTCSTPFNVNRLDVPLETKLGQRSVEGGCSPDEPSDAGRTCASLPSA
jgi:uncharacterized protein YceK